MRKLFVLLLGVLAVSACQNAGKEEVSEDASPEILMAEKDLPGFVGFNPQVREQIQDWAQFSELQESIGRLRSVEAYEDYVLLADEIIEKLNALQTSKPPELFDINEIHSRLKIVRTYALKLKADLHYRQDPVPSMKEIYQSYNAYRNQFNVTVSSQLDTKILFDE